MERRFLPHDSLQIVLDYLTVEGFPMEEYKLLSSWPRRDVSQYLLFLYYTPEERDR